MVSNYIYISLASTVFCIIGYIPEIYTLCEAIYNKIEQRAKSDMWSLWILSSLLSTTYAFIVNDTFIIINTSTILILNTVIFLLKSKYISDLKKIKPEIPL